MNNYFNPALDLVLTRTTTVAPELVWKAWTTPDLIVQWFTPKPWTTPECEIDLRPGGRFYTLMQSPEGETFAGESCILEVVENKRLVWTSGLIGGFRPTSKPGSEESPGSFPFTAIIELEPNGSGGTNYKVTLVHGDEATKQKHDGMGFETGWGAAFDQLVELMSKA